MNHNSQQWWSRVKVSKVLIEQWLRRQYVGEMAAVNLLSELLLKYGGQASPEGWKQVHMVMQQEALHAYWVYDLLAARGFTPEVGADATRRYWAEVVPAVTSFQEGCAAGYHAEKMRLERIRAIAHDNDCPEALHDVQSIFRRILPHEEWHEKVFDGLRQGATLTQYHEQGLRALNLVLQ